MKNTTKTTNSYTKISTGVYKTSAGTYRARKTINGNTISAYFTNKTKAIAYYKSLTK